MELPKMSGCAPTQFKNNAPENIILHHYQDNFDMTQKSMRFTNGEFVESTHYSIKNEERTQLQS